MAVDGWIHRMKSIHALDKDSALERKNILAPATTWMNLEDMRLRDVSWTQEDNYYTIQLTSGPWTIHR